MSEPARHSDLSLLVNAFRRRVPLWITNVEAACGVRPRIIETKRTKARQDWLYASGRTRPGLPIVTHLKGSDPRARHVHGLAFDFMWEKPDFLSWDEYGPWVWSNDRPWVVGGMVGVALGMTYIPAGGSSFLDLGHLQWDH